MSNQTKICSKCGAEMPIQAFSRRSYCNLCLNAIRQETNRINKIMRIKHDEAKEELIRNQKHILDFYRENVEFNNDHDIKVLWAFHKFKAQLYKVNGMI